MRPAPSFPIASHREASGRSLLAMAIGRVRCRAASPWYCCPLPLCAAQGAQWNLNREVYSALLTDLRFWDAARPFSPQRTSLRCSHFEPPRATY